MPKDYQKKLIRAKNSESNLITFYNVYYKKLASKHDKLYSEHISNLDELDKSIPNLKSFKKIFIQKCPNEIKPKKFNEKNFKKFTLNNNLFLKNYKIKINDDELKILKTHLKIQIEDVIKNYFSNMMGNIKTYTVYIVNNSKSSSSKKSIKSLNMDDSIFKKSKRKGNRKSKYNKYKSKNVNFDYRSGKEIKVRLNKPTVIKVIFKLKNSSEITLLLNHSSYLLDKKEIFNMLKNVISHSNKKSKYKTFKSIFKEQEAKIEARLLEEKRNELLEKQNEIYRMNETRLLNTNKSGKTRSNKSIMKDLENKLSFNITKTRKSNKSNKSNKQLSLKFKNNKNKSTMSINELVDKQLKELEQDGQASPFDEDSAEIDQELQNFMNKKFKINKSSSKKSKKKK